MRVISISTQALVTGILVMAAVSCSGGPREVYLPPQTLTDAPTDTGEEPSRSAERPLPPSQEEALAGEASSAGGEQDRVETVVIQGGKSTEVTPRSLVEASRAERVRRASAEEPIAVITNRNLADHAEGGQLTFLGKAEAAEEAADPGSNGSNGASDPAQAAPASATAAPAPDSLTEEFWRTQALKLRLQWKEAVENVARLEEEVSGLRRRFYAEDDPFFRDNEIKPAWDRALEALGGAREKALDLEDRLDGLLEAGRRAGALPGWLREGVEYEPERAPSGTAAEGRRRDDPREPKILDESAEEP